MGPSRFRSGPRTLGLHGWRALSTRHLELVRASGALAPLSTALNAQRVMAIFFGDFEAATSLGVEESAVKEVTGARKASYGALLLAAYQGRTAEALQLVAETIEDAADRGEGLGIQHAHWATAVLHNGLGQYADALPAAEQGRGEGRALRHGRCASPNSSRPLLEADGRTSRGKRCGDWRR